MNFWATEEQEVITMESLLDALCATGLYRAVRLIRNRFVVPQLWRRTVQWRQFYSQFVSPGDLVFDVGANRGDRTETFVQMGARVIAVEPLPQLAARLKKIFRYCPVHVEAVGVGRVARTMILHVCTTSEDCSSFSEEFIADQRARNPDFRWDRSEPIQVVTMDSLIEKHGTPAFIKIDVEGFESDVLAGLAHPVQALSFEVRPGDSTESLRQCLEMVSGLGKYEFNLSLEERLIFELPAWANTDSVLGALGRKGSSEWRYGDVYARQR
jgi:FkbM family methyltransferase